MYQCSESGSVFRGTDPTIRIRIRIRIGTNMLRIPNTALFLLYPETCLPCLHTASAYISFYIGVFILPKFAVYRTSFINFQPLTLLLLPRLLILNNSRLVMYGNMFVFGFKTVYIIEKLNTLCGGRLLDRLSVLYLFSDCFVLFFPVFFYRLFLFYKQRSQQEEPVSVRPELGRL
jgi:hypothetical protein